MLFRGVAQRVVAAPIGEGPAAGVFGVGLGEGGNGVSYEGRGGRGPCALGGAPRRRQGEAAAHAAPHLSRGLDEGRARLRRLEVGLEEEVEERRRALEVHEEERRRELHVERYPVTDR